MTIYRPRRSKSVLVLLMLFSLLLQVQAVFACQVDETMSGSVEHCCCDHDAEPSTMSKDNACCDYSSALELAGSDPDDRQSVVVDMQPLLKLPPPALQLLYALLPENLVPVAAVSYSTIQPLSERGRQTYLSTLRLRI